MVKIRKDVLLITIVLCIEFLMIQLVKTDITMDDERIKRSLSDKLLNNNLFQLLFKLDENIKGKKPANPKPTTFIKLLNTSYEMQSEKKTNTPKPISELVMRAFAGERDDICLITEDPKETTKEMEIHQQISSRDSGTSERISEGNKKFSEVVGTFKRNKKVYETLDESKENKMLGRFTRHLTSSGRLIRRKKQAPLSATTVDKSNLIVQIATVIKNICNNNVCPIGMSTPTVATESTETTSQSVDTGSTEATSQSVTTSQGTGGTSGTEGSTDTTATGSTGTEQTATGSTGTEQTDGTTDTQGTTESVLTSTRGASIPTVTMTLPKAEYLGAKVSSPSGTMRTIGGTKEPSTFIIDIERYTVPKISSGTEKSSIRTTKGETKTSRKGQHESNKDKPAFLDSDGAPLEEMEYEEDSSLIVDPETSHFLRKSSRVLQFRKADEDDDEEGSDSTEGTYDDEEEEEKDEVSNRKLIKDSDEDLSEGETVDEDSSVVEKSSKSPSGGVTTDEDSSMIEDKSKARSEEEASGENPPLILDPEIAKEIRQHEGIDRDDLHYRKSDAANVPMLQLVPFRPRRPSIEHVSKRSIIMLWSAPRKEMGPRPESYIVEQKKEGGSYKMIGNPMEEGLKVSSLEPGEIYFFKIKSKNSNGTSTPLIVKYFMDEEIEESSEESSNEEEPAAYIVGEKEGLDVKVTDKKEKGRGSKRRNR